MNATHLLNSGHSIPLIGFGTFQIRGAEYIKNVLDFALKAGYRHIDSAVVYRNEHDIGEALNTLLPKYNLKREDIFITSKLIPSLNQSEDDVISLIKTSLRNLQTEYIDLYLIHWPGVSGLKSDHPDNSKYRQRTWKTLVKLHKQGLIRSIGVSNYLIKHLELLLKDCDDVVPAVNQVEWHPRNHSTELLQYCRDNKIFLQAYSSLGSSNYTTLREDETVIKIAEKLNKTPAQVLLRYSFQQGIGILPKASSEQRIDENFQLDFVIPQDDMDILSNLNCTDKFVAAWDPTVVS